MSEARMLQESSLRELSMQANSLGDRLALGLIQDRLMNSPFSMTASKGKPFISQPEDLGYTIFGPLIQTFWTWFIDRLRADAIDKILFLARDGWFFHKIYQELRSTCPELPESDYLPVSRRLCTVAAFFTAQDVFSSLIDYFYCGRQDVFFRMRLGIEYQGNAPETIISGGTETAQRLAEENMPSILDNAARERQAYMRHLANVLPDEEKKCAMYDFGCKGTIQKYLQKICARTFNAYYFIHRDTERNKLAKANALFLESKNDGFFDLNKKTHIFEAVFNAPGGSYLHALEGGGFVTNEASENRERFATTTRIHDGVRKFMAEYKILAGNTLNCASPTKSFSLACLTSHKNIAAADFLKHCCCIEDSFCGSIRYFSSL
jgi:hypothetical protein